MAKESTCPICGKDWSEEEKQLQLCGGTNDVPCTYPMKENDELTLDDFVDYDE